MANPPGSRDTILVSRPGRAPAADDVFKCALKPLDPADYKTAPTPEQMAQLRQVFPDGVCDYNKPGVEQAPLAGTWVSFKAAASSSHVSLGAEGRWAWGRPSCHGSHDGDVDRCCPS
jgi:Tannase-like family of unknown function (DUF6351)